MPVLLLALSLTFSVTSCDKAWPDDLCDCEKGNNSIGGWGDVTDTTIVNKKDTLGGFEVSLDDWGDISHQDIRL